MDSNLHNRIDGARACSRLDRLRGSLTYGQSKLATLCPTGSVIDVDDGDDDDVADGESDATVLVGDVVESSTNVITAAVGVLVNLLALVYLAEVVLICNIRGCSSIYCWVHPHAI